MVTVRLKQLQERLLQEKRNRLRVLKKDQRIRLFLRPPLPRKEKTMVRVADGSQLRKTHQLFNLQNYLVT
jgi:hypothetical protein